MATLPVAADITLTSLRQVMSALEITICDLKREGAEIARIHHGITPVNWNCTERAILADGA
jgi:hypothetical protein